MRFSLHRPSRCSKITFRCSVSFLLLFSLVSLTGCVGPPVVVEEPRIAIDEELGRWDCVAGEDGESWQCFEVGERTKRRSERSQVVTSEPQPRTISRESRPINIPDAKPSTPTPTQTRTASQPTQSPEAEPGDIAELSKVTQVEPLIVERPPVTTELDVEPSTTTEPLEDQFTASERHVRSQPANFYTIQVGAFLNHARANVLTDRYPQFNFQKVRLHIGSNVYVAVLLGSYENQASAREVLNGLKTELQRENPWIKSMALIHAAMSSP